MADLTVMSGAPRVRAGGPGRGVGCKLPAADCAPGKARSDWLKLASLALDTPAPTPAPGPGRGGAPIHDHDWVVCKAKAKAKAKREEPLAWEIGIEISSRPRSLTMYGLRPRESIMRGVMRRPHLKQPRARAGRRLRVGRFDEKVRSARGER